VRLGLMQVAGLSEAAGQRIVEARRGAAFSDVHDLAHRRSWTAATWRG